MELGSKQEALVVDSDDRVFLVRASQALLGRPPVDEGEVVALEAVMGATTTERPLRRAALLDCLMGSSSAPVCSAARDEFTTHYSQLLMDVLQVSRRSEGDRYNPGCWLQSGLGALPPTERAQAERAVAQHVARSATTQAASGAGFSMLDVLRGSVQTDLRAALRANLFAQSDALTSQNQISETNKRSAAWVRFSSAYLNRQQLCLGCHHTEASVTGPSSGWNRFSPLPYTVEKATYGCSNGECVEPPDLEADFRVAGVLDGGSERPWGMSFACGTFTSNPPSESACPPLPANPLDPGDPAVRADVCFVDQAGMRRAPVPRFAASGVAGSVFRLDQLLYLGSASLAQSDLNVDPSVVRDVGADATAGEGARGLAMMVAASIVDKIWEEVHGTSLTIALHYPRSPDARDLLFELSRELLHPASGEAWSLRHLLKRILLRPEFNAAPANGDEYDLPVVFNAWAAHDPRPDPPPPPDCAPDAPTFWGCMAGVLRTGGCGRCHGDNSPEDMQLRTYDTALACEEDRGSAQCASTAAIDCATHYNGPGVTIAVRLNCSNAARRMPQGDAPLPEVQRLGVVRWVQAASPVGTPPSAVAPPTMDGAGQTIPAGFFTRNGVGDGVHWKSPFQVTYTMGSTLFRSSSLQTAPLSPWVDPTPQNSVSQYPSRNIVEAAGHYLDDTIKGGRGFALLGLLAWERAHAQTGEPCRYGAGEDAIDRLVAAGGTVEGMVSTLKLKMMGEAAIEASERDLLQAVVGTALTQSVDASNVSAVASGLRRACNVFMKSPLFLLSYVPPPDAIATGRSTLRSDSAEELLASASSLPVNSGSANGRTDGTWRSAGIPAMQPDGELFAPWLAALAPSSAGNAASTPLHRLSPRSALIPAICDGRLDCVRDEPELTSALERCWQSGPFRCDGEITTAVAATLQALRLPVAPPALDLERALIEDPGAVPTPNDPRSRSSLLILPLAGGTVTVVRGSVWSQFEGRRRPVRRGDTLRFAETLLVEDRADLAVRVGGAVYATGPRGMEAVPGGRRGWGRDAGWHLLVNGPAATTGPAPGRDPRIEVGSPLGEVPPSPRIGPRPVWAQQGEGGLWYARP